MRTLKTTPNSLEHEVHQKLTREGEGEREREREREREEELRSWAPILDDNLLYYKHN